MMFFSRMLADGYKLRLRVTGASMSPFLENGSYVTLFRIPPSDLKVGDIIFCRCDDETFKLHRLISIKNELLITKGDALGFPDKPFEKMDYQGKVIRIEHHRPHAVVDRNMELRSAQTANYLIAIYFRLKLNLIRKYFRFKSKPA
jgi:signal peptidase I